MARNVANSVENNFTKGLITEASGLNFPENACTDTDNCHFELTGEVRRRLGFDFETDHQTKTIDRTNRAVTTYLWRNVSEDGNVSLVVMQVGSTLYFYDANVSSSLSTGALATTIDLTAFQPAGAPDLSAVECQFADGFGFLFVTHPYMDAIYVTYNDGTQTVTGYGIGIEIRDFTGDENDIQAANDTSRMYVDLDSLNVHHHYNLLNQGWTETNLSSWSAHRADIPNNIDVMWLLKRANTVTISGETKTLEVFDSDLADSVMRGNTPAPRGHFILSVFNQDRDTVSGLSGTTSSSTGYQRMSTCAFFSGRVFFSGLQAKGLSGNIYFSRIVQPGSTEEFGQCYQLQDPTAEDLFDLLPNDGGVISIPDAGTILKLWATQGGLIAFATNGVWMITGSSSIGFAANDYTVRKIAAIRTISPSSFVDIGGYPAWWSAEGIYTLLPDQSGLSASVKSMTDTTILLYYTNIPTSCKKQAKGFYDPVSKKIHWIFRSTEATTVTEIYEFDKILVVNMLTGAFNPWSVTTSDVKINSVVVLDNVYGTLVDEDQVVDDAGDIIVDEAGEFVISRSSTLSSLAPRFKYLVSYPSGGSYAFTFADEKDANYVDWKTYDSVGVDYTSYVVSGYKVHGQAQRKFQSNYVYLFSQAIPGKYYFQGIWNYANTGNSGKWTSRQLVNVTDTNYDIKMNRLKVRGEGLALQFKVSSVPGQPFEIIGWSVFESANAQI